MKKQNALLYVREKGLEQMGASKETIESKLNYQEEQLRLYCEQKQINIVGVYREIYTAQDFNRPEFNKILAYIKEHQGAIDLLLFLKWDRFSRNYPESFKMIDTLEGLQVKPYAVEQPLDLKIPENKMMLAFYQAMTTNKVSNACLLN